MKEVKKKCEEGIRVIEKEEKLGCRKVGAGNEEIREKERKDKEGKEANAILRK